MPTSISSSRNSTRVVGALGPVGLLSPGYQRNANSRSGSMRSIRISIVACS